jgi:hypothetical protein
MTEPAALAELQVAVDEWAFDGPPHLRHPLKEGERPAGGEHVEREAGMAPVQQLEERLRQHRVADPRRRDYQDFVHVKRMLAGIEVPAAFAMRRRVLSFEC